MTLLEAAQKSKDVNEFIKHNQNMIKHKDGAWGCHGTHRLN
jgi:hypothetical protein